MNKRTMKWIVASAGTIGLAASPAWAQPWSDDFESYPLGEICGQGGWEEWVGSVDVCGSVTDEQALSGIKSLKIVGAVGGTTGLGDDTVHRFNHSGGIWTFSIMTFVPGNATGKASIILLNTYPALFNSDWSLVIALNADSGFVEDWPASPMVPLITDRWVEFRAEIDIDNDLVDYFYDGSKFLAGVSWADKIQFGGQPTIQALDLYGGEPASSGTTGTYFDDVSLVPTGACPCACAFDTSTGAGICDFLDFTIFAGLFVTGDPCACDIDTSTGVGVCDFIDYTTFAGQFAGGCP